jgi:hypothetical protein
VVVIRSAASKRPGNEKPAGVVFDLKSTMDWNRVEGNWKEFQGKVKEKWGKLTDDDLTAIKGKTRPARRSGLHPVPKTPS